MTKLYFSAPLFSEADRMYNEYVYEQIKDSFDEIYIPQKNKAINDKANFANSIDIAKADLSEAASSDYMIALLDGSTVDDGVAAEIGFAYAKGIPVFGLLTDVRHGGFDDKRKIDILSELGESQFNYINLFVVGLIKSNGFIVDNISELKEKMVDFINA
ncbi:MAG: nucleoside 2-deoxyribosyltransferase [Lactobacillaceae bacterium]|jgi:nucleoside 2-deoxyribosyltransferase|nr:nucleoside 2-deoxyribosyltransferase [Lactobacillaceae bacterium]